VTAWADTTAWGPMGLVVDMAGNELSMCKMRTLKAKHYSPGWMNFTAERQFPRRMDFGENSLDLIA
jgi:hypothetical protein